MSPCRRYERKDDLSGRASGEDWFGVLAGFVNFRCLLLPVSEVRNPNFIEGRAQRKSNDRRIVSQGPADELDSTN